MPSSSSPNRTFKPRIFIPGQQVVIKRCMPATLDSIVTALAAYEAQVSSEDDVVNERNKRRVQLQRKALAKLLEHVIAVAESHQSGSDAVLNMPQPQLYSVVIQMLQANGLAHGQDFVVLRPQQRALSRPPTGVKRTALGLRVAHPVAASSSSSSSSSSDESSDGTAHFVRRSKRTFRPLTDRSHVECKNRFVDALNNPLRSYAEYEGNLDAEMGGTTFKP